MSRSHEYNLPIICMHQSSWGVDPCWPNVVCHPYKDVQENCDTFGIFSRLTSGLWDGEHGKTLYINPGVGVVGEYKETKGDLHADEKKPCRRRDVRAMGDYRFVWIRRDGDLRTEMVPVEGPHYGWGVVEFDDLTWEITRPSARFANVARWETVNVLNKYWGKHGAAERAHLMQAAAGSIQRSISGSAPNIPAQHRYKDKHTIAAEKYIGDRPDSTARLKRHLESETGWSGSETKLTKHLKQQSDVLVPPPAGGDWTVKDVRGGAA
ncbi:MAG: hypothetical protein AAGC72_11140 [Planctomycetota bacterium]